MANLLESMDLCEIKSEFSADPMMKFELRSPKSFGVTGARSFLRPPPVITTDVELASFNGDFSTSSSTVEKVDTPHRKLMEVVSRNIPLPKNYKTPKAARKAPTASIKWTNEEDMELKQIVSFHGAKNWRKVAELLGTIRSDVQCQHRWNKVLKPGLQKGPWTEEEDNMVREMVNRMGIMKVKWSLIAQRLPGRIGKQCRERWFNHLSPDINRGDWTTEEDRICHEAHKIFGNRWKEIAKLLPGRTENAVKNRFNSASFKKWVKDGMPLMQQRVAGIGRHAGGVRSRGPIPRSTNLNPCPLVIDGPGAMFPQVMLSSPTRHLSRAAPAAAPVTATIGTNTRIIPAVAINAAPVSSSSPSSNDDTSIGSSSSINTISATPPNNMHGPPSQTPITRACQLYLEQVQSLAGENTETSLSMLPYFRYVNKNAQRSMMRQLIDINSISSNTSLISDPSHNSNLDQSPSFSTTGTNEMSIEGDSTTTTTSTASSMLQKALPPASPTTTRLMIQTGEEILNERANNSASTLNSSLCSSAFADGHHMNNASHGHFRISSAEMVQELEELLGGRDLEGLLTSASGDQHNNKSTTVSSWHNNYALQASYRTAGSVGNDSLIKSANWDAPPSEDVGEKITVPGAEVLPDLDASFYHHSFGRG